MVVGWIRLGAGSKGELVSLNGPASTSVQLVLDGQDVTLRVCVRQRATVWSFRMRWVATKGHHVRVRVLTSPSPRPSLQAAGALAQPQQKHTLGSSPASLAGIRAAHRSRIGHTYDVQHEVIHLWRQSSPHSRLAVDVSE